MLHCLVKTSWGGDTEFADLRNAYDTSTRGRRPEIQDLEAEHFALQTRTLLGDEAYTDDQKR
jgi:alpha-ketoglutarate-dependent 2,4-dichlorophenoxyacetate dioxygenase